MGEMAAHQDRFIIGLTGNIGTGKSLVRKMLQHLGAYGIDADFLTHEALKPHGPAVEHVLHRFGSSILDSHGAVDRVKLAHIVFNDEKALDDLENILHPFVSIAAANIINHARLPIIIIEAIKLLDSDLADICDSVGVVEAPARVTFDRLSADRGMDRADIKQRLSIQSSPEIKKKRADVVIENSRDAYQTWLQVARAWDQMIVKEPSFASYVKRTSELLAFTKGFLVTPSSESFSTIENLIYKGDQPSKYIKWLVDKKDFPPARQDFNRLVCQYFLFAFSDIFNNQNITFWDLSQYELTLSGYTNTDSDIVSDDFKKMVALIEQFSSLHITQRIVIPIEDMLKERNSFLRGNGYKPLPRGDKDFSDWNKAGYNLYKRKVCDAFDLFRKPT